MKNFKTIGNYPSDLNHFEQLDAYKNNESMIRLSHKSPLNEEPIKSYYDEKVEEALKRSIDVEKIIHNLNYFPNRPTILSANPVTKEGTAL